MKPVVDTNVLIHGKNIGFDHVYLVQGVLDEVESRDARNSLKAVSYNVEQPEKEDLSRVREKSSEINSPTSRTDERLLALAMSVEGTLVTDDKALQNLALHLGEDSQGFLDDPAEEKFCWKKVCEGCGKQVNSSECPFCGSSVRLAQVSCSS